MTVEICHDSFKTRSQTILDILISSCSHFTVHLLLFSLMSDVSHCVFLSVTDVHSMHNLSTNVVSTTRDIYKCTNIPFSYLSFLFHVLLLILYTPLSRNDSKSTSYTLFLKEMPLA